MLSCSRSFLELSKPFCNKSLELFKPLNNKRFFVPCRSQTDDEIISERPDVQDDDQRVLDIHKFTSLLGDRSPTVMPVWVKFFNQLEKLDKKFTLLPSCSWNIPIKEEQARIATEYRFYYKPKTSYYASKVVT